jgi:hypothetical protein
MITEKARARERKRSTIAYPHYLFVTQEATMRCFVCCYPMQNLIFSLGPRPAVTRGARGSSDEFDVSLLFGVRGHLYLMKPSSSKNVIISVVTTYII